MNYSKIAKSMQTSQLVSTYNHISDKPVKKFSDRATAEKRVVKLLTEKGIKSFSEFPKEVQKAFDSNSPKVAPKNDNKAKPKVAPKKADESEIKLAGPKSKYLGKKLYKKQKENPRQAGSHGWHSHELIKDGMTYEQFRMAGGRSVDLRWDVSHGYVEVK